jgi:Fic family protein
VLIDFIRYNRFGETAKRKRKERYAEKSKEFWSQFDGYYTTRQAADLLGISYREAYRLDTTYGIAKEYCDHALRGGKHKGKFVMYKKEDIDKIKATESNKDGRLSSVEIRKKYKIEYNELLQIVNKGLVKADKIRNRLYIDEEDVKKYLQSKKRKGKQK